MTEHEMFELYNKLDQESWERYQRKQEARARAWQFGPFSIMRWHYVDGTKARATMPNIIRWSIGSWTFDFVLSRVM